MARPSIAQHKKARMLRSQQLKGAVTAMPTLVPRSFLNSFVLKSTLLFVSGAFATSAIFYLAFHENGTSYADSYGILNDLNNMLLNRVAMLFISTLAISILAVIILSVVYSHRVAGALHKLGMYADNLSSGNVRGPVRLRKNDVVHPLADDMNELASHYANVITALAEENRNIKALIDEFEKQGPGRCNSDLSDKLSERVEKLRQLLLHITL
ncbi:MAG TPA: hypothetical protein VEI57_13450 [Nitrospirota bacterium]|nr:hypothetical protein [Nitrospirota bacterium]